MQLTNINKRNLIVVLLHFYYTHKIISHKPLVDPIGELIVRI